MMRMNREEMIYLARPKREWYPGATFHVMSRGNRRAPIFADDSDYLWFLEYILEVRRRHGFKVHSICLMTNHFHMALETEDIELWKIMQKLLSIYAEEYNHRHHYTGHLFEGRYTACLIEDERYFLEVSRYIHLNPVKAQMVRSPLDYEYSSYGFFVDAGHDSPEDMQDIRDRGYKRNKARAVIKELVDTDRILDAFRHNKREQYRMFVEGKILLLFSPSHAFTAWLREE